MSVTGGGGGSLRGLDELTQQFVSLDGKMGDASDNWAGNDTGLFESMFGGWEPAGGLQHVRGQAGEIEMAELVAIEYVTRMYFEIPATGGTSGQFMWELSFDSDAELIVELSNSLGSVILTPDPVSEFDQSTFEDIEYGMDFVVDDDIMAFDYVTADNPVIDGATGVGGGALMETNHGMINFKREFGGGPIASPHDEGHLHWALAAKPNVNDFHVATIARLVWDTFTES